MTKFPVDHNEENATWVSITNRPGYCYASIHQACDDDGDMVILPSRKSVEATITALQEVLLLWTEPL